MNPLNQLWVHDSVRAHALSQRRKESLFTGELDQRFHYMSQRQAQLWMEVHKRHAPLFRDPEFSKIFENAAAELASELAGESIHLVALGAGGGEKEALVLAALRAQGCRVRYTPLDVSVELALLSAEAGKTRGADEVYPVAGDLSALDGIREWPGHGGERRVFTAFGLAPNMRPDVLFGALAGVMRTDDALLLSANLAPVADGEETSGDAQHRACREILPQYDNLETRLWLRQVLVDWGLADALNEPVFEVERIDCAWGIAASCHWLFDAKFEWEGRSFEARRGTKLMLFYSLRYTTEILSQALQKNSLLLGTGHAPPCKQEGVWRVVRGEKKEG